MCDAAVSDMLCTGVRVREALAPVAGCGTGARDPVAPMQERAIRIAMDDGGMTDEALAAATARLSGGAAVPRETLLEFAWKFTERSQHGAAVHAFLGAGCPGDALAIVEQHAVRGPPGPPDFPVCPPSLPATGPVPPPANRHVFPPPQLASMFT